MQKECSCCGALNSPHISWCKFNVENNNQYQDNPDRKVYNIDFDGTLTDGKSYYDLIPNPKMVYKVRTLYYAGHIIIIHSARLWESASDIAGWCIINNVPFHGLMLGKGGSDYYIDDKAINAIDFIKEVI